MEAHSYELPTEVDPAYVEGCEYSPTPKILDTPYPGYYEDLSPSPTPPATPDLPRGYYPSQAQQWADRTPISPEADVDGF